MAIINDCFFFIFFKEDIMNLEMQALKLIDLMRCYGVFLDFKNALKIVEKLQEEENRGGREIIRG